MTTLSTGLFREPCRRCHVVHTLRRDQDDLPLCQGCASLEQAQISPDDISIYPMCSHRYSVSASTPVEEIADLKTQMCPDCIRDMIEFEWACEAEYQASKGASK